VKNVLGADEQVASFFIAIFSIGIAIGSVAINSLLRGHTSAKFGPATVLIMGAFVLLFSILCQTWPPAAAGHLYSTIEFIATPHSWLVIAALTGIAVFGGMFVVPLYAFLTTTVTKDETARTVAANNVVNSGAMALGAALVSALTHWGVGSAEMLYLVAGMCPIAAWLAWKLHRACD
jgi:predicted MFS family arabinose efflux permease